MDVEQLNNFVYCLPGSVGSNIYYINDKIKVLIDSGAVHYCGDIETAFNTAGLSLDSIDILIQTHIHADHCGNTAWLKQKNPGLTIIGSSRRNEFEALIDSVEFDFADLEGSPEVFEYDRHTVHGEVITTGNISLYLYDSPGHTVDSLSVYIPEQTLLISGDSVYKGVVTQLFYYQPLSISIQEQRQTLELLQALDVTLNYTGHGPPITSPGPNFELSLRKLKRFERSPQLALINNMIPLIEISLTIHKAIPRQSMCDYFVKKYDG